MDPQHDRTDPSEDADSSATTDGTLEEDTTSEDVSEDADSSATTDPRR
ncbi:hypothetical protein [Actinomycetospora soli]|nr:hypothetical protein [Actinomycetospora soli]MCD2186909.1 hypothetical protein [Actinomycetospora soli]